MERSRRDRTPIFKRSKGACTIGTVVALGCAVFGVGVAGAGDGSYARHLRAERMLGAALARRTPEQVVLAVTPRIHHTSTSTSAPVVHQAPATPAPTATQPATTPAPASTTTTTQASTTPAPTTAQTDTTPQLASTNPHHPFPNPSGTTPTGATANAGAGATGTNPSGTPGEQGTPGTTTTGNSTTSTTSTTTSTTTASGQAVTIPDDNGRPSGNGNSTPSPSTTDCHGRCSSGTEGGGVVPASLPPSTSPSTTSSFSPGDGSVPANPAVSPTPTAAVSSTGSLPTSLPSTGSSSTATSTPSAPTTSSSSAVTALTGIPSFTSTSNRLGRVTKGKSTRHSGTGSTLAGAGTGATTAATVSRGPAAPAAGTLLAAAGTAAHAAAPGPATVNKTPKRAHPSSGGSGLPTPISTSVQVIDHFVNVVPTAVWMALGAAFALALAFAGIALRSSRRARRREREFAAISTAAATDALTGILNRRGFMDAAEREIARASRYERPFVLAYVDVRGLKTVNDTEGHLVGDELIKTVAGLMRESARADDVVGRIGGDEFALLLDEQTAEGAEPVVRRIQSRVEEARAGMEIREPWELTIGIAAFPNDGDTLEELLGTADRRLYEQRGIALR
jgi:diguanylate cyclase (GGDEF)-like protein